MVTVTGVIEDTCIHTVIMVTVTRMLALWCPHRYLLGVLLITATGLHSAILHIEQGMVSTCALLHAPQ